MQGVRWSRDIDAPEGRCDACAEWYPIEREFWPVEGRGWRICRACNNLKAKVRMQGRRAAASLAREEQRALRRTDPQRVERQRTWSRDWMRRSRAKTDPVTPTLRIEVLNRDGGCLAVRIGGQDPATCAGELQLDHVKDAPRMGRRAPSDARHLATVCRGHHIDTGWATANRPLLRSYLSEVA